MKLAKPFTFLLFALSIAAAFTARAEAAFFIQDLSPGTTTLSDPSLAFDPSGHPHISFCDRSHDAVTLGDWNGSAWSYSTVNPVKPYCSYGAPLKIDPSGTFHLVYASTAGLQYQKKSSGSWAAPQKIDAYGFFHALALDSNNRPHVAYQVIGGIKYAKWNGESWQIQTFSTPDDIFDISLALDSAGLPHIAYYELQKKDLVYAHWDGLAWSTATVESAGDVGSGCAIAVTASGQPLITYGDDTNKVLKMASPAGSAWNISTIDTDVFGGYSSLVIDSGGQWHVSYGTSLGYAKQMGSSLRKERASRGALGTSLALDPDGKPFIASVNIDISPSFVYKLSIAQVDLSIPPAQPPSAVAAVGRTSDSITWTWQDNSSLETAYRVVRASDHVSLSGDLPPNTVQWTQTSLLPATSQAIQIEMVTPLGTIPSTKTVEALTFPATPNNLQASLNSENSAVLTWNLNGNPAWIYYFVEWSEDNVHFFPQWPTQQNSMILTEPARGKMNYFRVKAVNSLSSLFVFPDSFAAPAVTSLTKKAIAFEEELDPFPFFFDETVPSQSVSLFVPPDPRWRVQTVDASTDIVGQYNFVAVDKNNSPEIVYDRFSVVSLKRASVISRSWQPQVLSDANVEVNGLSFTIGPDDVRYHTFTAFPADQLVYTALDFANPTLSTGGVISAQNKITNAVIRIDRQANKHVAYLEEQNNTVRYAFSPAGSNSWSEIILDPSVDTNSELSLAVGPTGAPVVVYTDAAHVMKRAQWTSAGWVTDKIVTVGASAVVSLAIDSLDRPHIAYCGETDLDIVYGRWTGSEWAFSTVASQGDVCTPSLALDRLDQPMIAFTDGTNGDLKYAFKNGSRWEIEMVDSNGDVGRFPSLALDKNDVPHISYFDQTNGNLKYARGPALTFFSSGGQFFRRLSAQFHAGEVELLIPSGALPDSVGVNLSEPGGFPGVAKVKGTGVGVTIDVDGGTQPSQPATLKFSYRDADVQGFDENKLVIAWFDPQSQAWTALPSTVDAANNQVSAQVGHFSLFQMMAPPAPPGEASVKNVIAYPVPLQPSRGFNTMTFDNMPTDAKLHIYTLAGEQVKELTSDGTGKAFWQGQNESGRDVASGVYFVLVEGTGGKKTIKVAVQR